MLLPYFEEKVPGRYIFYCCYFWRKSPGTVDFILLPYFEEKVSGRYILYCCCPSREKSLDGKLYTAALFWGKSAGTADFILVLFFLFLEGKVWRCYRYFWLVCVKCALFSRTGDGMFYGSIILFRGESEWFPYLFDVFTEAQKVQIINYKASCFLNLPKSISGGLWHRPMNLRTDGPSILCPGWAVCRRMDTVPVPPIIQSLFSRLPVSDTGIVRTLLKCWIFSARLFLFFEAKVVPCHVATVQRILNTK